MKNQVLLRSLRVKILKFVGIDESFLVTILPWVTGNFYDLPKFKFELC